MSGEQFSTPTSAAQALERVRGNKFIDEAKLVGELLHPPPYDAALSDRIEQHAVALVERVRAQPQRSTLDRFLSEYGLSNQEGIALMCLAEALLRIPDGRTADFLIADKLSDAAWSDHLGRGDDWLVNASTWGLMLTGQVVQLDRLLSTAPVKWFQQLVARAGEPVIRSAMRQAMHILGDEFVLGQSIAQALARCSDQASYSFDMLGEAARDAASAQRYFDAYLHAIEQVPVEQADELRRHSVSVKLSALHPRYDAMQWQRSVSVLSQKLLQLALAARERGIGLAVDAEEADRLSLSLQIFADVLKRPELRGWDGLGLVVQAYGKRALPVLEWLAQLARESRHRVPVRLVKGAYWDSEIKHAQVMGYDDFPVFTLKRHTDLSYLACVKRLFELDDVLYPQFATHNAHTLSAVMAISQQRDAPVFEFQRLHGMGESLYAAALEHYPKFPPLRIYAPVGSHEDLLAYLVRRLLENGANSSFVNRLLDAQLPAADVVTDPVREAALAPDATHPNIPKPADIYAPERANSCGWDLTELSEQNRLQPYLRAPATGEGSQRVYNPADPQQLVGRWQPTPPEAVNELMQQAAAAFPNWSATTVAQRGATLLRLADGLESQRGELIGLLVSEAGKTIADALAEVREAVDFCRYYAQQAEVTLAEQTPLPGPTGESNVLVYDGRGVFICISPWNFPLAIFLGQVSAALMAGNAVVAKPAEQTTLIALAALRIARAAGVPEQVLQLACGDGQLGRTLVAHPLTAGVAFTGSTTTAREINRVLAQRDSAIAPLIAETGGQNAMLVDSSALLEQVTDDVVQSAFGSAGQRCSALRVLYLQTDIAEQALAMIQGAMQELVVGDPAEFATDVGPIITQAAADALQSHIDKQRSLGCRVFSVDLPQTLADGYFVAPTLIEIEHIDQLEQEHFGPVLHVIRFAAEDFEQVLEQTYSTGFGLTLGLHSRVDARIEAACQRAPVGNVYVNRNMIGAVVGTQPFGGRGLSGTGPKAGGPHYLMRFATEKVISINTAAAGGNAALLSMDDQRHD